MPTDRGMSSFFIRIRRKGKPVFTYNFLDLERFRWEGPDALVPGKHTLVFDFTYDGPGIAKGGAGPHFVGLGISEG